MIEGFIQFGQTERQWLEQLVASVQSGELFEGPKWTPEMLEAYAKQMAEFDHE
ncbi:hypothetical protein D3C84_1205960 [compost metagenome]